jgi:hypothetical protein
MRVGTIPLGRGVAVGGGGVLEQQGVSEARAQKEEMGIGALAREHGHLRVIENKDKWRRQRAHTHTHQANMDGGFRTHEVITDEPALVSWMSLTVRPSDSK